MIKFKKKLFQYVNKNIATLDTAPCFKYDENTIISPEIALELMGIFQHSITIQELWEKEKDYNRLLRKENSELQKELQYYYDVEDNNNDDIVEDEENSDINTKGEEKEYIC